jgi:hypothetical protein
MQAAFGMHLVRVSRKRRVLPSLQPFFQAKRRLVPVLGRDVSAMQSGHCEHAVADLQVAMDVRESKAAAPDVVKHKLTTTFNSVEVI